MLRPHKFNPLRNNVITVRQDCCQPCPITLDRASIDIGNTPLDVVVTNPIDLTTLENTTSDLLTELRNQPQIEGISTRPVCYDDGTSGSVGVKYDEEADTYSPVYFDEQENVVTGKTIIPCEKGPETFLGDPIEVCI